MEYKSPGLINWLFVVMIWDYLAWSYFLQREFEFYRIAAHERANALKSYKENQPE
jgi:hypothetical protein